jgi:ADP-ribosylation factor-like protein 8
VDASDHDKLDAAKQELASLLGRSHLASVPVLVLGNKNDLPGALKVHELITRLYVFCSLSPLFISAPDGFWIPFPFLLVRPGRELEQITNREVSCYSVSAKNSNNIDVTIK